MKKYLSRILSFSAVFALLIFMSSCSSAPKPDTSAPQQTQAAETSCVSSETTPAETLSSAAEGGVYLDGKLQTKSNVAYTYNPDYGNFFTFAVSVTENETLVLTMLVTKAYSSDEVTLNTEDLRSGEYDETAFLTVIYINTATNEYYEYYSLNKPEMFENVSFSINSYEFQQYADFTLSADVTLNGSSYSLSGNGRAEYTETHGGSSADSDSGYSDGTCLYCGGSGICRTCSGMGYTAWGGYDNRIDCTTCGGSGSCYYCQGTGIQVYASRGVLIQ